MAEAGRPSAEEIILYEKNPKTKIATITFNRPEYLHAPTAAARLRYSDLLYQAGVDDEVKVVVIRGAGEDLGSGADLPEFMELQNAEDEGPRLAEFRIPPGAVTYPPRGTFRRGASVGAWYASPHSGIRTLQDFKKISILEVKGYCYGWHFYQAADADLVISSDDALFGHPSFRYYGWGPRMWWWTQTMGIRKFQEMVYTGRPFTAAEMYDCNFLNSVVRREDLEAEVARYALACARNRPTDTIFQQKMFFEVFKQFQGEYLGSLLGSTFESLGGAAARDEDEFDMHEGLDSGLAGAVKDNDSKFPPEWRLSKSGRPKATKKKAKDAKKAGPDKAGAKTKKKK
jgi:enoyl-CoA hydratase/carnithine racemase